MKKKVTKIILLSFFIIPIILVILGGGYTYWNAANPGKTCASCHEISPSHQTWANSAHSRITCFKCHGTALSNGWHSLSEKANMVFTHVKSVPHRDEIRMTEEQILETMQRCKGCHENEFSNWLASGHSANYSHIFLDSLHNTTEQLNFDCLRCHGMFYAGTTYDLVEPISVEGPWNMKDKTRTDLATIPCMACHKIHSRGMPSVRPDYANPDYIFYGRVVQNNSVGLYVRHEKIHFDLENLPTPVILSGKDTIQTPNDPVYRLCVQCHAPSVYHQAGSSDDNTPTGVHEGISCRACHEPHSNYQRNSCDKCHSDKSKNCKLNVRTMNTTYISPESPNNIHRVACKDCHDDGRTSFKSVKP